MWLFLVDNVEYFCYNYIKKNLDSLWPSSAPESFPLSRPLGSDTVGTVSKCCFPICHQYHSKNTFKSYEKLWCWWNNKTNKNRGYLAWGKVLKITRVESNNTDSFISNIYTCRAARTRESKTTNTDELPTSILPFRRFVFSKVLCNVVNNHLGYSIKSSDRFIFILTSKAIQWPILWRLNLAFKCFSGSHTVVLLSTWARATTDTYSNKDESKCYKQGREVTGRLSCCPPPQRHFHHLLRLRSSFDACFLPNLMPFHWVASPLRKRRTGGEEAVRPATATSFRRQFYKI